jgi:hypothetical protein
MLHIDNLVSSHEPDVERFRSETARTDQGVEVDHGSGKRRLAERDGLDLAVWQSPADADGEHRRAVRGGVGPISRVPAARVRTSAVRKHDDAGDRAIPIALTHGPERRIEVRSRLIGGPQAICVSR